MKIHRSALLYGALLLALPLLLTPFGAFYRFLRISICLISLFSAYQFYQKNIRWATFGFLGLVIVYNPFFPLQLAKDEWALVYLGTCIIFLIAGFRQK